MRRMKPARPAAEADDKAGHRNRLRDRLLGVGGEALADYELVEFLLMLARPRVDTKPLAKALLREFGGIGPLLDTDIETLRRFPEMGDSSIAALKLVKEAVQRTLYGEIAARPVLGSWQGLLDYLRSNMAFRINECVHVLHLDSKNRLIRDEIVSEGTIDESAIHVREVVRRALDFGAAAIILAHNHPGGDPSPSKQDIAITREIVEACRRLGIAVHDHVIVGREGSYSMRSHGLI